MTNQKYIVVFKDGVSKEQVEQYAKDVDNNGGQVTHRYEDTLNGFSAVIPEQYLSSLKSLQEDVIDYIEPDGVVTTQ